MALTPQQTQIARLLYHLAVSRGVSPKHAREFVEASYEESGLNPRINNRAGSGAAGLFQLLSSGYVNKAKRLGGVYNPRANALAILPDYARYWASHPNARPGEAGAAVERSGEGAEFYSRHLGFFNQLGGGESAGSSPASAAPLRQQEAAPDRRSQIVALIQAIQQHQPAGNVLEALGAARAPQASAQTPSVGNVTRAPRSSLARTMSAPRHRIQFIGDIRGENPAFLAELESAVAEVGGTKVRVISGRRSPAHNAASGGVPHSNHLTGDAMDGEVYIPGHGWVPLGVALQRAAGRHGLRSGNVPGFYHGGRDPNHVDDGRNVRGGRR